MRVCCYQKVASQPDALMGKLLRKRPICSKKEGSCILRVATRERSVYFS